MFDGDNALASQLLDLLRSVLLPVLDIGVVADAQRAAREDDRAHIVVEARGPHGFLVRFGRSCFVREDESRADPYCAGAQHQRSGDGLSVVDTSRGDNLDWLAGHRTGLALAQLDDRGDQDRGGNIAGVAAALASLRADDVDAEIKTLLDVLRVADHIHV